MEEKVKKVPQKKRVQGIVVSDRMEKTVVVRLERITQHPKYKKYIKVFKKVYAHNEGNKAKVGDWVILRETRPLSRLKRWVVEKIVKKGSLSEGQV